MKADELNAIERRCMTQHPRYLRMSLRHGEGWALHGLIRVLRPQTVVEIGRLVGVSSSWILAALEGNHTAWPIPNSREDESKAETFKMGHLHSIDIQTRPEAVTRLAPWVKKGMVTLHEFSSHGPESEALAEKLGTVDFIFIDGDHSPDAVEADCRLWLPRVRGYALFHDWGWESVRVGIRRAVDLEKFSRHIMIKEHIDPAQTHATSHGLMLLYLPEGLEQMPVELPGRPGHGVGESKKCRMAKK